MKRIQILVSIALTCLAVGCSSSTQPEAVPANCQPETQVVQINVVVGSEVTFDWAPACGVRTLFIEPIEGNGGDVWQIESPGGAVGTPLSSTSNLIEPPITYGAAPPDIITSDGPAPLVPGTRYVVGLYRVLPPGVSCEGAGSTEFCRVGTQLFTR